MNPRLLGSSPLLALVSCLALAVAVAGRAAEPVTVRSRSGQFVVSGLPPTGLAAASMTTNGVRWLRLDPTVVTVSCEQIKQELAQQLALGMEWRGVVQVAIRPAAAEPEPVRVIAVGYSDGWSYRIELPETVDEERYFAAVVEVLVREVANRRARYRQAEIPPWLVEGLTAHLRAATGEALVPQANIPAARQGPRRDALGGVREVLQASRPLSFNELCWPQEAQFQAEGARVYRACAHLLVAELLRLKDGRRLFGQFLQGLPEVLNWQTAFLRAYREVFPGLVDLDKWWALVLVSFTRQEQQFFWGPDETLQRLAEIMSVPVEVRRNPNELPLLTQVPLRNVLAEWDWARQQPILAQKINHLQALGWRADPEVARLVAAYQAVLLGYLQKRQALEQPRAVPAPETWDALRDRLQERQRPGTGLARDGGLPPSPGLVIQETVRQLNRIDAQRLALGNQDPPPARGPSGAQP